MPHWDIRLVALDLDGTVFDDEKNISPRTLRAFRAALDRGVDVIPATGRQAAGVPEEFLHMPGVRYALTANGASVVELATGRSVVRLPFDDALARAVLAALRPFGGVLGIFIDGGCCADADSAARMEDVCPPALLPYVRASRHVVPDLPAYMAAHSGQVEKFSILYPDDTVRDAAKAALAAACPGVEITSSMPRNLEVNAPGVNKGRGLLALAAELELDRRQVMACGDSGNDLEMIRAAGLGVAMGNASPDVLAAADVITLDNNHDGVAAAIETYVLHQTR